MNLDFADLKVGDTIAPWSRQTELMNWNRFAAVNDEFVPFHMDDEAGRAAKNERGAFGMGNLRYTYVANALRDWAGDEVIIREIGVQFRAINQKHDVLTVTGRVTSKDVEDDEQRVRLEIDVVNQNDESTCPGHAILVWPVGPA
ncbi:MAG: hypothetical protein EXR68_06115 [Dehalococcoidia bacterium]|nr:hypothetical protein [Dehalococcoidia bacterium]